MSAATQQAKSANGSANGAVSGLYTALLAVQSEAPTLPKDGVNPHFRSRYTPLDTIVEKIGPLLAKHGLVWTALPCRDEDGQPALRYRLIHAASGEQLEGVMPLLLTKTDPQGMGSGLTYARRYSLCAVLNLVADEDDDGSTASQGGGSAASKATAKAPQASQRPATAKQQGKLNALFAAAELPAEAAKALVLWTSGQPIQDRLSSKQASALIDALGEDGSGAHGLIDKLTSQAEAGEEKAQKALALMGGGE